MKESTQRTLENFVEKANKLKQYGLDEHIAKTGSGFRMQQTEGLDMLIEFDLPVEKEMDASLLTLRLFTQQNEDLSFHRLDRLISDDGLSSNLRSNLTAIRKKYLEYLDGHHVGVNAGFFEPGMHPTRGEVLTTVLNGGLAHIKDRAKRERYKLWTRDEIRASVLIQVFAQIVRSILLLIYHLADLCEQELAQSRSENNAG